MYEIFDNVLIKQRCEEQAQKTGEPVALFEERFAKISAMINPVIDFYDNFGKVTRIDASRSVKDVY
jgi:adenylate kinase family enzyme